MRSFRLLIIGLFVGFSLPAWTQNPPMSQFNHTNAFEFDEEYVLSNMVYAINERCRALYRDYITVSNCVSPSNIVHRYWIDPINEESWSIAWGDMIEATAIGTATTVNAAGQLVTNLFTYTNQYVGYEYPEDADPLPEGYIRVPLSRFFNSVGVQLQATPDLLNLGFREIAGNTNIYPPGQVLLKLQQSDFSSAEGLRLVATTNYLPCQTNYFIRVTTLYDEIFSRVVRLSSMFIDNQPSLEDKNKPLWRFEKTENLGVYTVNHGGDDPPEPGIRDEVGECPWSGAPGGFITCWQYLWREEWVNKGVGEVRDRFHSYHLTNYFDSEIIGWRQVVWTNHPPDDVVLSTNLYVFAPGWVAGLSTVQLTRIYIPPPILPISSIVTKYSITSEASGTILYAAQEPWGSTNDPINTYTTNALVPLAQIDYAIVDAADVGDVRFDPATGAIYTNAVKWRAFRPQMVTYPEVGRTISDPRLYTLAELTTSRYFVAEKSLSTNKHVTHPPVDIIASNVFMGVTNLNQNIQADTLIVYPATNYPDRHWWSTSKDHVPSGWIAMPAVSNMLRIATGGTNSLIQLDWKSYNVESMSITNVGTYTSLWIVASNGIARWVPDFDPSAQIVFYKENPLPVLSEFPANTTGSSGVRTSEMQAWATLWGMLKRMRTTYASSWSYSSNSFKTYNLSWPDPPEWANNPQRRRYYVGIAVEQDNVTYEVSDPEVADIQPSSNTTARYNYDIVYSNKADFVLSNIWVSRSGYFDQTQIKVDQYERVDDDRSTINLGTSRAITQPTNRYYYVDTHFTVTTDGGISMQVHKSPAIRGTLRVFSTLLYDTDKTTFWARPSVPYWDAYNGNNEFVCAIRHTDGSPSSYEVPMPGSPMIDYGEVFSSSPGLGIDRVSVNITVPRLPGLPPQVGYDNVGVLPLSVRDSNGDGNLLYCGPHAYGSAHKTSVISGSRYFDLYWEWDFDYATDD